MSETTAHLLREALGAVAGGVRTSPDAYERALNEWRRRERRRRMVAIGLAAILVALADAVGLWALNRGASMAPANQPRPPAVVFGAPAPAMPPT